MHGWFHSNKMHTDRANFDHVISFNPIVRFENRTYYRDR